MESSATAQGRVKRLEGFLSRDPGNLSLLGDAALAAYEEGSLDLAAEFLNRHIAIAPLSSSLMNLQGVIALGRNQINDAVLIFERLRHEGKNDPAVRFNLAWCYALLGSHKEALEFLDDEALSVSSRAPALKIEMMHHLGLYDDALACGDKLAQRYPNDQMLMGALATLAMDAGKSDIAYRYAAKSGENPEGQTVLGLLMLGEQDAKGSLALFEKSLAQQPNNARAWMGKGLSLLASGNAVDAAKAIDEGAELFETHLGSWVASGWAYFVIGDYKKARDRFERVVAIDPNFAEGHGGLAVLDVTEGKGDDARRRAEIALRLDRKSLGGALAKSMLLDKSGHAEIAQKIRDAALSMPIGPNGRSIAQALAGFGSRSHK